MQKLQGWVEQGNTTLTIGQAAGVIARKVQGSFPGATVTVYINSAPAVAISSISRTANVVTVTIAAGSGFIAGEQVTIASVTDASFNGTFTILASGATTFTYAQTAANASSSGGTATSTLRLATIYSDNAASPTAKANPFVSASNGTWFLYAANGRYDVKFSGAGIATPFTLGDFELFDPQIIDSVVHASYYPGADASIKIAAAIAVLPSTGGIVDARGFTGTQTFSTNPFAAIPAGAGFALTVLFNAATFHVQTTMTILQSANIVLKGISISGEIALGTVFQWDGANGGTVLLLDTSRDMLVEGIQIVAGTGTIGIGILTDQVHPFGPAMTNINFKFVRVGASTTGIQIGKDQADGNNAEITFEDCIVEGAGTYGYYIKYSQSKNISFMRGTIANRSYGIYHNHGASRIYGINFSANTISDIFIGNAQDTIFIEACHDENGFAFLKTPVASGAGLACYLLGNSWVGTGLEGNPLIEYGFGGPVVMIGNDWTTGSHIALPKFNITSFVPPTIVSMSNIFPNDQMFTAGAHILTSIGDRYWDAGGNLQSMPNVTQASLGITGTLAVTGNETVSGTLGVTGLTSLVNAALSGTLGVTGAATLSSTLAVTGATTVGTIGVGGDATQSHLNSGIYTPTASGLVNCTTVNPGQVTWLRIGTTVIGGGGFVSDTVAAGTPTQFDLTLPGGITAASSVAGVGTGNDNAAGSTGPWGVHFTSATKIRLIATPSIIAGNQNFVFTFIFSTI